MDYKPVEITVNSDGTSRFQEPIPNRTGFDVALLGIAEPENEYGCGVETIITIKTTAGSASYRVVGQSGRTVLIGERIGDAS
jgi:hypothetical protein